MTVGRAVRRLASAPRRELVDLVRAEWALATAWARVRLTPSGRFVRSARVAAPAPALGVTEAARARALEHAVLRAARHGPLRSTCLVRSLAIQQLLHADGIAGGRIEVGVRLVDGEFAAHAWVELGDLVLGDDRAHVRSFTPVDSLAVAGR